MGASYFAGGNTCVGFYSRFEDVLQRENRRRIFFIKGGPGVGKSGLMEAVASDMEAAGAKVERFKCSGDPASTDAVAFPELGAALMDGTAPHVYDPEVVGARDTLISLGDRLDEKRLRLKGDDIASLQSEISGSYRRCYAYLSAASAIARAAADEDEDASASQKLASALADEYIPAISGQGRLRRLFARAYTHRRLMSFYSSLGHGEAVCVPAPPMRCADALMSALTGLALNRGHMCVALLHPLWPEKIEGLYVCDAGVLFTPEALPAARTADMEGIFSFDKRLERERGFDRNAFELIEQRAVEQLSRAKALHDELETHYIASMDFSGHTALCESIVKDIMGLGDL